MAENDDDLALPPVQDGEPQWAGDLRTRFDAKSAKLRDAQSENRELKRQNVLLQSGVTLDEDQQKALLASIDGDLTVDAIKDKAAKFGWYTPPVDPAAEQQQRADQAADTQQRVADATSGGQSQSSTAIKPADVESWTADRWGTFKKAHPAAAEALLRGEEVTGLSLT